MVMSFKLFTDSVTSDAIYKIIDTNRLRFRPLSIRQYEAKYFMIGEEIAGKQLLQDAADRGQLDAIFVLGMMLMAEGIERKQEALSHYSWLLNCEICLWDACFVKFAMMFDISLECHSVISFVERLVLKI
uniref:At2g35280-like TPR domain-containing protein n=1 Tax=Lactuca sativa TaxID=4236 RepID=A0A9R1V7R0_LACSA|nr:hypothetical protein LSAT_V11C600300790 [Lactuca sativa]